MAKIKAAPELEVVDWYKGTLDFYDYMGLHVVRKWPHWPKRTPWPAEKAAQDRFAYITRAWSTLDPYLKSRYLFSARGTNYTARDLYTRLYLRGLAP